MRRGAWSSMIVASELSNCARIHAQCPAGVRGVAASIRPIAAESAANPASDSSCVDASELQTAHCRWYSRSEEHTSELQSLMRISYAVFCLKKKNTRTTNFHTNSKKPDTRPPCLLR